MNRKQRQQNGTSGSISGTMAVGPTPSIRQPAPAARTGPGETQPSQNAQGRTASPRHPAPGVEEIRVRAYELYLTRNGRNGTPEGDWLQAELDLRDRAGRITP